MNPLPTIKFLVGRIDLLDDQSLAVSLQDRVREDGGFSNGFSTGICGQDHAGTLGGFVTLLQDGEERKGFLTSSHVVCQEDAPTGPSDNQKHTDQWGSKPTDPMTLFRRRMRRGD